MLTLYRIICLIFTPFYGVIALLRLIKGKEDLRKIKHRFGFTDFKKENYKDKTIIWVHCASVGETLSALPFLGHLHKRRPDIHFVLTTYTRTAADIVEQQAQNYAGQAITHSYIPYDNPIFVAIFLNRLQPDTIFWFESEFWPEIFMQIKKRKIKACLLNLRLSQKSMQRWKKIAPNSIKNILSIFDYTHAQTLEYGSYFEHLTGRNIHRIGNMKYAAPPLSYSTDHYAQLSKIWEGKTVLLFASTHKGEEDIALNVFEALQSDHPNLILVIVPRHPYRGASIKSLIQNRHLKCVLRSEDSGLHRFEEHTSNSLQNRKNSAPNNIVQNASHNIYVADTLGELGLFYALANIAVIGNSFVDTPGGGHNPLEAAHHDCCILYGASIYNFQSMHDDLQSANAVLQVENETALKKTIDTLLHSPSTHNEYAQNAKIFSERTSHILDMIYADIKDMLPSKSVLKDKN